MLRLGSLKYVFLGFMGGALILSFQNCGESLDLEQLEQQSLGSLSPRIDAAPMDRTFSYLSPLELEVQASGDELVYQWFKDGVEVPGQVSAVFAIPQAQESDAGLYTVVVGNSHGQASHDITVSVSRSATQYPPTIASLTPLQANVTAFISVNNNTTTFFPAVVTFSATVSSPGTLTYQWYRVTPQGVATAISGATSASLTVNLTSLNQGGTYRVVVNNGPYGSDLMNATLNITPQVIDIGRIAF